MENKPSILSCIRISARYDYAPDSFPYEINMLIITYMMLIITYMVSKRKTFLSKYATKICKILSYQKNDV